MRHEKSKPEPSSCHPCSILTEMQLTFDDVAVYFSEEQWRNLSPDQRQLYKEVMKENYAHLLSLGLDIETPDVLHQIEEWEKPGTSNTRKNEKSMVSSRKEIRSPMPKALTRKPMEILPVPSTSSYILSKSEALKENQTRKEATDGCETPRQKKKLKDLQRKCLICKGVYKCYCGFAKTRSKKQFVCEDCGKGYSLEFHLIGHQKTHYGRQPYKCSLCEKSFKKPGHLRRHQKTHTAPVEYKCHRCQLVFQTVKDLKEHRIAHQKEYMCTKCGETFKSLQKLKSHEKEAHSRMLECSLCHQRFRYKIALVNHQREHVESEVYKCHKCKKVYTRLHYLLRHAEVHFTKNQGGDGDLNAKSPSKEPEEDDRQSPAHTSNMQPSPYHDGVTDEAEATSSVFPLHPVLVVDTAKDFWIKGMKKEPISEELLERFDFVRLFKCKKCKKCFKHHSTLMRHALCHSLVFICHYCGQKFGKLVKLYLHKFKHECRRPYKCTFCEKAFSFQSLLHLHQSTHDTSKPAHGWVKSTKSLQIPSETFPITKMFTAPSSLLLHQTTHGIQATRNPSEACPQSTHNIKISPTSPGKISEKRPRQEMVGYKDYVKRVCYRSCESRNTM